MECKSTLVYGEEIPSGLTSRIRTPSPCEYLPSYLLSEGNVYKSPIFIKSGEANVPVKKEFNSNGDSCQISDSKKSTNRIISHVELPKFPRINSVNMDNHEEENSKPDVKQHITTSPLMPIIKYEVSSLEGNTKMDIDETVMQDVTNVVKGEPVMLKSENVDAKSCGITLQNGTDAAKPEIDDLNSKSEIMNVSPCLDMKLKIENLTSNLPVKKSKTVHKKANKLPDKINNKHAVTKSNSEVNEPVVIVEASHHPSALVEKIDYKLLEGKKGVDLLTAIELQTNVNLSKMEFHLSSSSESNGNVEKESPRKARTRSVESAVWDIQDKRERKGVKRPRSVETESSCTYKVPKLDLKNKDDKTSEQITQVPSSKHKYKHKDHTIRDKPEHRSAHKSSSKSSSDRRRAHKVSIGIQARPSSDSRRHYLKLLEARPALLPSGNYCHSPTDVSTIYFCFKCFLFSSYIQMA